MAKSIAKPKKKGSSAFNIIMTLIVMAGAAIISYPSISDWWNQRHASQAIATYQAQVEKIDNAERKAMIEEAKAFNATLPLGANFTLDDEKMEEYYDTLDITGTGIMGYIEVPKIGVNLPIYHGIEDTILQIAIGHIPGTSLPVGGETTHAVVSGHRGLPSAMLFTDLDRMTEGDIFTVTVLDEMVTYQVDQIRIVLPEDTSNLAIESGRDYMTLVTCTPYGVNSHRMLVRGTRIDNLEAEKIYRIEAEANKVSTMKVMLAVTVPLIMIAGGISLWLEGYTVINRRSHSRILEDLESLASDDAGGETDEK